MIHWFLAAAKVSQVILICEREQSVQGLGQADAGVEPMVSLAKGGKSVEIKTMNIDEESSRVVVADLGEHCVVCHVP
jgi:hypothetical protein